MLHSVSKLNWPGHMYSHDFSYRPHNRTHTLQRYMGMAKVEPPLIEIAEYESGIAGFP